MNQHAPIRVLVVEDEVVNCDVVCQILEHFGCQIHAVDNGLAALQIIRERVFDVVFMDCRMAEMDGLETTRRLRAGEAGPRGQSVPIVALTAQAFLADRQACLNAGMNDFLTKPVELDHLIEAVNRWGRSSAAGTANAASLANEFDAIDLHEPLIFDPAVLAALPMVADGSQPGYGDVVLDLYLKSLPNLLATLRQALAEGRQDTAVRTAHSLKSSSAAVGAMAMSTLAAEVEMALRTGQSQVSNIPSRFEAESERLHHMLGQLALHDEGAL